MATLSAYLPARTEHLHVAKAGGLFLAACLFFAIAFPKGGIKLYGVPITFGYALTLVMIVNAGIWIRRVVVPLDRGVMIFASLLLALWSTATLYSNGTDDYGYTIAYFVAVVYIPLFGLIVFSAGVLNDRNSIIESAIIWAIRLIVGYGIFLFLFKMATGQWIEIPYLTVNADDLGTLDEKMINRGGIYKLISTYNNGNIFGVTMCIIGPLYLRIEPGKLWRTLFYAALVLTLSRTVWIGLIFILTMRSFSSKVRVTTFIYGALSVLIVSIALYLILNVLGLDMSFIFDRELGGRVDQLSSLSDAAIISQRPGAPLSEIVYMGVLGNYGWIGLLLFTAYLALPALLLKGSGVRLLSLSRASACLQGVALYLIIAGSDAAFSFIPVMMVFWMVVGLGLWYRDVAQRPRLIDARSR